MNTRLATAALALTLMACGGGDDDGGTGPEAVTLDGNWVLAVPNISGSGLNCSATGMTMSLAMSSATAFAGSHTTGVLACDGQDPVQFTPGPILNGTLNGHSVAFDFDDANFHFVGNLNNSETSISGTNTLNLSGTVLSGTWTATHQNAVRALETADTPTASLREHLTGR